MIRLGFTFGAVRQMQLVGDHPDHKKLRARNEARLARLKQDGKLYEEKKQHESAAARNLAYQNAYNSAAAQHAASIGIGIGIGSSGYTPGNALQQLLDTTGRWI